MTFDNAKALQETAKNIFKRIKLAYEMLPNFMKPGVIAYAKEGMELANGSSIGISTTTSDAARGESINCLLLDEAAFIPPEFMDDFWESVFPVISSSKKSKIFISDYEVDSNQRIIMRNGLKVKLTEKELELILALDKNNGLKKSFLLNNIWNRSADLDSHAFETNLHRLRKKVCKVFNDKNFIIEKDSLYYISK